MPARRLGLFALVLALVLAGGVHYDAREEHHRVQPTTDEVLTEYDRHVGERTLLFGTVEDVDPDAKTATVRVDDADPTTMHVRGFEADALRGGSVQVYGTLRPDRVIDAETVVVVNRDPGAQYYKYAASAVGALGILVSFFRDWRIDWSALAFAPRGDDDG